MLSAVREGGARGPRLYGRLGKTDRTEILDVISEREHSVLLYLAVVLMVFCVCSSTSLAVPCPHKRHGGQEHLLLSLSHHLRFSTGKGWLSLLVFHIKVCDTLWPVCPHGECRSSTQTIIELLKNSFNQMDKEVRTSLITLW